MFRASAPGRVRRLPGLFKRTLLQVLAHDCLNVARSAAYSAMVALFPAMIVAAAVIALLPDVAPLKVELGLFFERVIPPSVSPLLNEYFNGSARSPHTTRTLVLALVVSVTGATSVLATLMEGLRRATHGQEDAWTFLERRRRALLLAFVCLLPLLLPTLLVMFGELLTRWISMHVAAGTRAFFVGLALLLRWVVALAGVTGLTSLIYSLGTPPPAATRETAAHLGRTWVRTLPGAVMATLFWFAATLLFGVYVRRYANYNVVYGSLGAGIALLFWLFLVFFSVLCGAEFNAQWAATIGFGPHDPEPEPLPGRTSA